MSPKSGYSVQIACTNLLSCLNGHFLTACYCSFQREDSSHPTSIVSVGYHVTILLSSKNSFFSISTHRDNTFSYTATYRDNKLSLLHFDFQHSTPRKCIHSATFSFLSCLFSLTCYSLEHNHRNFIKSQKRQTTNMGEDTYLLGHIAIFLCIDTLHEILSTNTFYSRRDTFNI